MPKNESGSISSSAVLEPVFGGAFGVFKGHGKTEHPSGIPERLNRFKSIHNFLFGVECEFSNLRIPEKREGFDRLIVMPGGVTSRRVFEGYAKISRIWAWSPKCLDEIIPWNERDAKNGTYAIWVKDVVEVGEAIKNLSANDIRSRGITTETLAERLIHGADFFLETGGHLDAKSVSYCTGSRYFSGKVPVTVQYNGILAVEWFNPDVPGGALRSREVVA